MAKHTPTKQETKQKASEAKKESKPWIRRLGRFGYMSQGFVYILIGVLAFMTASGVGGDTEDTSGALQTLASMPFGEVVLWLVGIGLTGYVIWMFIRASVDTGHFGNGIKGFLFVPALLEVLLFMPAWPLMPFPLQLILADQVGATRKRTRRCFCHSPLVNGSLELSVLVLSSMHSTKDIKLFQENS